jgi:hypothetical protein
VVAHVLFLVVPYAFPFSVSSLCHSGIGSFCLCFFVFSEEVAFGSPFCGLLGHFRSSFSCGRRHEELYPPFLRKGWKSCTPLGMYLLPCDDGLGSVRSPLACLVITDSFSSSFLPEMAADVLSEFMMRAGGGSRRWLLQRFQCLESSSKEESGVRVPMFAVSGLLTISFGDSLLYFLVDPGCLL